MIRRYAFDMTPTEATRARRTRRAEDLGIVDALVQLSFVVQAVLTRVAAIYDVSLAQVRLCGALRDRELGMAQVARLLSLDKSSTTGLVDRAERRGLVCRTTTPEDGRAVRVVLTAEGRRQADAFAAEVGEQVSAAVAGLSETSRERLSRLASQVVLDDAAVQGFDLSAGRLGVER